MDTARPSTFLASLVAERRMQPEPVATAALTHLLANSSAARQVLAGVAQAIDPAGTYEDLSYTGQAFQPETGRPDIVGYDSTGWRLLIEAKFDAALTPPQAGTQYVDMLKGPGILFYLVPRNRLSAMWPQLLEGPCGHPASTVPPAQDSHADLPWLAQSLGDGRLVVAVSWEELLRRLHGALDGGGDVDAVADLAQLTGLVQRQVRIGYLPLASGDLPERAGRQLNGLKHAAMGAAKTVSAARTTNGSNDWGPARWVNASDGRRLFWVGLRIPTWARLGLSPVWAVIVKQDLSELRQFEEALQPLQALGGPGVFKLDKVTIGIPVIPPTGAEQGAVEESFVAQLTTIRGLVEPLGKPSEELAAEALGADDETGTGT